MRAFQYVLPVRKSSVYGLCHGFGYSRANYISPALPLILHTHFWDLNLFAHY